MKFLRPFMKFKHILLLLLCVSLTQIFAANLSSKFRTAVFWNDGTAIVPDETPAGYKRPATFKGSDIIGDFTAGLSDADLTSSPEIGRSALKLFLTALDKDANYDQTTTLDTASIKVYLEDNSGVIAGADPAVLPNVRIYSIYDDVSFQDVIDDFNGEFPEVITVINAGGDLKQSDLDKMTIDTLLYNASKAEVGVFLLGSASTSFAVAIDKICKDKGEDPFFAVKGIQKPFNVQSYKGSLLFDFDLTSGENGDGSEQDSVVLEYDGTKHSIVKVSEVKFVPSTDSYVYKKGDVIYEVEGKNTPSIDKLHSSITVTTHWGQFVIEGAKAMSVISYDSYGPDMNSGVNYSSVTLGINGSLELIPLQDITADVIPAYSGNTIAANTAIKEAGKAEPYGDDVLKLFVKVKQSDGTMSQTVTYKEGESVTIPGLEAYGGAYIKYIKDGELYMYPPTKGTKSEDGTQFRKTNNGGKHTNMLNNSTVDGIDVSYTYKFTGGEKVVVWSQNGNDAWTKKDSIGYFEVEKIEKAPDGYKFTFNADFVINNSRRFYKDQEFVFTSGYELVYPKSGYSDLSIDMMEIDANGNSEIFTKIFQISKLGKDEKVPFKDWKDNGRIQCAAEIWAVNEKVDIAKFSDWYGPTGKFDPTKYYFGRFAQQFARGTGEFYELTENTAKDGFDRKAFDALPDDGNDKFKDKEYYTLSVIQHGHQRVAIAGYQPQYIEDVQKSINIITDLFNWTAVDDSRMPPPYPFLIKGSNIYETGDTIPTDVEKLAVVIDFTKKDQDVYDEGYKFSCDIEYKEGDKVKSLSISDVDSKKSVSGENIDTLYFDITGIIDSKEVDKTTFKIANAKVLPDGGNVGKVEESQPKSARYDIQKLVAKFVGNTTDFLKTFDVKVESNKYIAGTSTTEGNLPSGVTPTINIDGDEGPSIHTLTISDSKTVKAYAKQTGYINSDEITREYTKGSLTFPKPINTVPEDSILFVTDSVGLKVELEGELKDFNAEYKIEYSVEYDGKTVLTDTGTLNSEIRVAVKDFVDRKKVSVTSFKLTGNTLSQDLANWKSSGDTTYTYNVKKLKTDPDKAENIDFTGKTTLTIKGMYDDKEVTTSDILYTFGTSSEKMKSGEETVEFVKTVDLTFWAEDTSYINSDTVKDYHFEKDELTLPKPTATVDPSSVNGVGTYIFSKDTSIFLDLEAHSVSSVPVGSDNYTIDYNFNGVNGTLPDTGAIAFPLTVIDSLIDEGATALTIGAKSVSTDTDLWLDSDNMEAQSYEFRKVKLEVSKESGDDDDDSITVKIIAKDPVTDTELKGAQIYYTVDGSAASKSGTGPISSGTIVTVANGGIVNAIGYNSGYISGAGLLINTKEAIIIADPVSGTFFGEKLDVTLSSNLSPIYYTIDGGDTITISAFSGIVTLDDAIKTLIRDDDTVKIHAWVEDGDYVDGTSADFEYYRRKLEKVTINPASGEYTGDIDVTMSCSDGIDKIYYSDGTVIPTIASNKYSGEFTITPDAVIIARAIAEDWLPSDTTRVDYKRVASAGTGYYLDANADGIIDSAVIDINSTFSSIEKPDSIVCTLPSGSETITVMPENIVQDPVTGQLGVTIVGFNTILTGFSEGDYIAVHGDKYLKGGKTSVADSVAPVIKSARFAPGKTDETTGDREADILTVEFTEDVSNISIDKASTDQLFYYGGGTRIYTGDLYVESGSGSTYTFGVTALEGVTYPSKGDSIWIKVDALTSVSDGKSNTQVNSANRRVEMVVEKLPLKVIVRTYWMKDRPSFNAVLSPDDIPVMIYGDGSFGVNKGGLIIIDPQIPFAEEDAANFKATISILDAVGNEVITAGELFDKTNGHLHSMPALMRFKTEKGNVDRWVVAAAWDGTNASGREVHARTFKVVTLSEWPGIEGAIEAVGLVPVFKLSEEK